MNACASCAHRSPDRPKEGTGSAETRVTGGCELPYGFILKTKSRSSAQTSKQSPASQSGYSIVILIFKFQSIKNPHWLSRQMTQMSKGTCSPACPPEFYPGKPPSTPSKRRKLTSEKLSFSLRTCTHANVILKFQHSSNDIQCLWPSQEPALTYTPTYRHIYTIKNKNKPGMAAHAFNPKVSLVYTASSRTGKTT